MTKVINRKELASIVSCITKKSIGEVDQILTETYKIIIRQVKAGRKVQINNFGSFQPVVRKAKLARDIGRGQSIQIPPRRIPVFKASKIFREKVNYKSTSKCHGNINNQKGKNMPRSLQ